MPYSNTTNVKVKLLFGMALVVRSTDSNTTNVKVKRISALGIWENKCCIQIQPMLRLNKCPPARGANVTFYSNTTNVKVKPVV